LARTKATLKQSSTFTQAISPSEPSNSESHSAIAQLIHPLFSYELKNGIEIPVFSSILLPASMQH
jgi:hypothetical protein